MYVCGSIEKFSDLREKAFQQGEQEACVVYVCGSIEKFSDLREKAFQQGEQQNADLHECRLAPSGAGVKETLGIGPAST